MSNSREIEIEIIREIVIQKLEREIKTKKSKKRRKNKKRKTRKRNNHAMIK